MIKDTTEYPQLPFPLDADGWSKISVREGGKIIYVSAEGDDANDGSTPQKPVRTPARAEALATDGRPDVIAFRRGDGFEAIGQWDKLGKSATEPMVLCAYGDVGKARPKCRRVFVPNYKKGKGLAIVNLDLVATDRLLLSPPKGPNAAIDGNTCGIYVSGDVDGMLIEGCDIGHNVYGICVIGEARNLVIRRNFIHEQWTTGDKAQGIYMQNYDDNQANAQPWRCEENVFWRNGWTPHQPPAKRTMFSHSIYVQWKAGRCRCVGNFFFEPSNVGAQLRAGGTLSHNVFVCCPWPGFLASAGPNVIEDNLVESTADAPGVPNAPTMKLGLQASKQSGNAGELTRISGNLLLGPASVAIELVGAKAECFNNLSIGAGKFGLQEGAKLGDLNVEHKTEPTGMLDTSRRALNYPNRVLNRGDVTTLPQVAAFLGRMLQPGSWKLQYSADAVIAWVSEGFSPAPKTGKLTIGTGDQVRPVEINPGGIKAKGGETIELPPGKYRAIRLEIPDDFQPAYPAGGVEFTIEAGESNTVIVLTEKKPEQPPPDTTPGGGGGDGGDTPEPAPRIKSVRLTFSDGSTQDFQA